MNKYYFLLCSFPTINIGIQPSISFFEIKNYLEWNLSEKDKKILYSFKQYIDVKNLKKLWMGIGIDYRGNLDKKTISEILLTEDFFPEFIFEYLKKFKTVEDKINNFSLLESRFLKYKIEQDENSFLTSFFTFERDIKLILAALRAKQIGRDISKEIEGEDKKDLLISDILSQKDSKNYHPPKEYEKLKDLFLKNRDNPKILYRSYLEFCFQKYSELSENTPFIIDQILGYLANLILVEDYSSLDQEKGKLIVDSLL